MENTPEHKEQSDCSSHENGMPALKTAGASLLSLCQEEVKQSTAFESDADVSQKHHEDASRSVCSPIRSSDGATPSTRAHSHDPPPETHHYGPPYGAHPYGYYPPYYPYPHPSDNKYPQREGGQPAYHPPPPYHPPLPIITPLHIGR